MPFVYQKAESPRRKPLTAEEQALARVLFDAVRRATDKIKVDELARIIQRLDPDTLNRLLETISISRDSKKIQEALLQSIDIGGNEAIQQIKELAPKLSLPAFRPKPVKITNKKPMANMDFTQVPRWASAKPPKIEATISFNKTNPNSLYFAQTRTGQLITSIDEMTRLAVRKIIIDAFNDQIDYRATARRIKNVVGLHPKWAEAVVKYEKTQYARLIRMGIKPEKALLRAQEQASKYADSLKSKRATMISRTEIQLAQNEGRYEGWKQAAEEGLVDPQAMKMWVTAEDERTCDICAPLDGEIVPWNGTFSIGLEAPIVHPHCRCTMVILPPERS